MYVLVFHSYAIRMYSYAIRMFFFFLSGFFFHEHSRITGLQGKGEGISLTPHYHFHPLHRHLEISRSITAESSPLHISISHSYVPVCNQYVTPMSRISSLCHSYVLVYQLYVTRLYPHVICMSPVHARMLLVCTCMSFVCHSYAHTCTRMYSYVILMSLVCTRISTVCHSSVPACHLHVTGT